MLGLGYGTEWLPLEFWEYTTVVMGRFFEYEPAWDDASLRLRADLRQFREELVHRFTEAGIRCGIDNKTAFGLQHKDTGQRIYIGFYDGKLIIGSWVRSDSWNKPHRAKTQE